MSLIGVIGSAARRRGGESEGFDLLPYTPTIWLSDTGGNAAEWTDLSGNARHATQATSAQRPSIQSSIVNGRQVRRFDGNDDKLIIPATINFAGGMIFLVVRQYSLKNFGVFLNSNGNNGLHSGTVGVYGFGASFLNCKINAGAAFTLGSAGNIFENWCLLSGEPSVFSLDYLGYDSPHSPNADIAEFVGFTSAVKPSAIERAEIEAGLMAKYGL